MPVLEVHDLRPARLADSSLVLSSSGSSVKQPKSAAAGQDDEGGSASLLTLHYALAPSGFQEVAMRLQRPTVVGEIDFAIALLKYAVPSTLLGAEPKAFVQRDLRCVSVPPRFSVLDGRIQYVFQQTPYTGLCSQSLSSTVKDAGAALAAGALQHTRESKWSLTTAQQPVSHSMTLVSAYLDH